MTSRQAPLLRGLAVLAIGATLALGHIAFAAAAPAGTSAAPLAPAVQDVDSTSSIVSGELPENCYVDMQTMRSVRGKTVVTRVLECD